MGFFWSKVVCCATDTLIRCEGIKTKKMLCEDRGKVKPAADTQCEDGQRLEGMRNLDGHPSCKRQGKHFPLILDGSMAHQHLDFRCAGLELCKNVSIALSYVVCVKGRCSRRKLIQMA